jgi:hypothetical protein
MIDPVLRAAFEAGRRVVLDRREREARDRYEAWEFARQRDYRTMNTELARNDERAARGAEAVAVV